MSSDVLKQLRGTDFFKELSDDALSAVISEASMRKFSRDEELIRKGDAADSFFIILKGHLKIVTTDA